MPSECAAQVDHVGQLQASVRFGGSAAKGCACVASRLRLLAAYAYQDGTELRVAKLDSPITDVAMTRQLPMAQKLPRCFGTSAAIR